jgi:hypothetical protein
VIVSGRARGGLASKKPGDFVGEIRRYYSET